MILQKKLLIFLLTLITLPLLSFSDEVSSGYEHLYFQNEGDSVYISFGFFLNSYTKGESFAIDIIDENKNTISSCKTDLPDSGEFYYWKFVCKLPLEKEGEYVIKSHIILNGEFKETKTIPLTYFTQSTSYYSFIENKDESTTVVIHLEQSENPISVQSEIPKEVIEHLDSSNKNTLIQSDLEYIILKEDPLIAWNLDSTPNQINYTINKKISEKNKEKFKVTFKDSSTNPILNYGAFFLVLLLLFFIFKPILKKKK